MYLFIIFDAIYVCVHTHNNILIFQILQPYSSLSCVKCWSVRLDIFHRLINPGVGDTF